MIISRYFIKEILVTLAAVTGVLLLIFLSNEFVRYLARAASGGLPASYILKLMVSFVSDTLFSILVAISP